MQKTPQLLGTILLVASVGAVAEDDWAALLGEDEPDETSLSPQASGSDTPGGSGPEGQQGDEARAAAQPRAVITLDPEPVPAPAARDAPRSDPRVEEIVVSAQKRRQLLFDVPMSVSAFSGELLEEMGADNLSDIAAATPGFSVSESGPGVQSLQIRGISSAFGKATVGYQLDNVSLTSFSDTQPDAATFDLASVEILRGPQGTLYGEGSMGGTVKLQTRRPDFEGWQFIGQGGYFVTEQGAPSTELNGALNIPLAETQAARLVLGYADLGGFIDQVELQRPDDNYNRKLNARLRYLWESGDSWSASFMVLAGDIEAGSSNAADENYQQSDKAPVGIDDASQAYSLDLGYQTGWAEILFTNSLFTREIFATFDAREGTVNSFNTDAIGRALIGSSLPPVFGLEEPLQDLLADSIDAIPTFLSDQNDSFVSELRLNSKGLEKAFWTAGVFLRQQDETVAVRGDINLAEGVPISLADTRNTSDSFVSSVFGQFEYDWRPWLNMAIGGRYFREDLVVDIDGTVQGQDVTSNDELEFSAFTPRLTFSLRAPEDLWGFVDSTLGYVSYARGFRSGGANTRTEGSGVTPTYRPDLLDSYEIGGKMILWDRLLTVETAVFYTDWTDVQVIVQEEGSTFLTSIANAGNTEALGVDWNLSLSPLKGLKLIHSGAYIDTEYVTDTDSKFKGDPVDFVPPLQYSFAVSYSRPLGGDWRWMARVDYNYQDPSVQTSRTTGVIFVSEEIRMANARLGLEGKTWQLYAYGRNLLDNEGPLAPTPDDRQPRARPPHFGVQLNVDFH